MADYLIEFQAHIKERDRPENFPKSIFVRRHYTNVVSDEMLKSIYNVLFEGLVKDPGLSVFPEGEPIDGSQIRFDQKFFVPWNMISYFHGRAVLITPDPGVKNLADPSLDPATETAIVKKAKTQ